LAVLRAGGTADDAVWPGDDAPGAGHFGVRVPGEERPVAVATVVPEPHPEAPRPGDWRLRGMATDPAHQRRGYAALLVRAALDHARAAGAARVWLQARPAAIALYEAAGFVREGGEFEVPGLGPHVRMSIDWPTGQ
jgi:ribosomal protein S18 acetylase RimI-like enzyme